MGTRVAAWISPAPCVPHSLFMSNVINHSDDFPTAIPRLAKWDSSLDLLADPYRFIGRNCAALDSDVFETRLQLQPTICMTGAQAAELFHDPMRFQRQGAAPEPLRATLFGKGAVQGLDGEGHATARRSIPAVAGIGTQHAAAGLVHLLDLL